MISRDFNVSSHIPLQVERFANDNDYWLRKFGLAFTVMLNNGHFEGKLRNVIWDTFNDTYDGGDIFTPRSK